MLINNWFANFWQLCTFIHNLFLEQMPPCKNCFLFDEEKLEIACCFFTERHSLAFSLLNVVLNIQKMWLQFCKCDGNNICLPYQANICYRDYQYVVYKNCLNLDFLSTVRENLHQNLLKISTSYNHFFCEIINKKYLYHHKDWFTGENVTYDLDFCLTFYEKNEMNKIIDTDFKII